MLRYDLSPIKLAIIKMLDIAKLFSIEVIPIYTPSNNVRKHISQYTLHAHTFDRGVNWYNIYIT